MPFICRCPIFQEVTVSAVLIPFIFRVFLLLLGFIRVMDYPSEGPKVDSQGRVPVSGMYLRTWKL